MIVTKPLTALSIATIHLLTTIYLLARSLGLRMSQFDSGYHSLSEQTSVATRIIDRFLDLLQFPFLTLVTRLDGVGFEEWLPGVWGWAPFLLNSLLWGIVLERVGAWARTKLTTSRSQQIFALSAVPVTVAGLGDKIPLLTALVLSSGLSVGMWIARLLYVNAPSYFFLNWNLFLAWIPLGFALSAWLVAQRMGAKQLMKGQAETHPVNWFFQRLQLVGLLLGWLLFLPNSPYIVTDLIHLEWSEGAPDWFDALLVFSYAWNGLIVGIISVSIVQSMVRQWMGSVVSWLVTGAVFFASSFGIYLGRFLRWNSWDVLTEPSGLFNDILLRLLDPFNYPRTIVVTLLLTGMLSMIYLTLTLLARASWESPATIAQEKQ